MAGHWNTDVDVAICGGGFAGLLLARQMRLQNPEATVAVIDRLTRPLPEAAFKIGESTVELASYYMRDILKMADYMDQAHLRKLGLRFFFSDDKDNADVAGRPEYGLSNFATKPSYQIDRGRFENDLRDMIVADGAQLMEGTRILGVEINEGEAPHVVTYQREGEEPQTMTARWVIDASGRKQMIQRQLGLSKRREADHNAVWFRVDGEFNVDDLVPASDTAWHDRVPGRKRWFSTNHFVGNGYWVWIIPLASGKTSIGIVADQNYHPLETFQTRPRALEWLARHEPALARHLENFELLDFGAIKNYSHTSSRVFSADGWACIGDAGVFADPMYAPGADLVAFACCCTSWLVAEDMAGRLTPAMAEEKSRFIITLGELLTRSLQVNYHILGNPQAMATKLFWDITAGWAFVQPLMFGQTFLDSEKHAKIREASKNFFFMSLQMNTLFSDWRDKGKGILNFDFIDYLEVPEIRAMRERNLIPNKSIEDLVEDQHLNMRLMEDMTLVMFKMAVADCLPDHAHKLEGRWLNPFAISLNPDEWEERGLFKPRSEPRDLSYLTDPLYAMFNVPEPTEPDEARQIAPAA